MKKVILFVVWVIWTLMCIYGTYHNTVINAELGEIGDGYYEIEYHNTGDIYRYGSD